MADTLAAEGHAHRRCTLVLGPTLPRHISILASFDRSGCLILDLGLYSYIYMYMYITSSAVTSFGSFLFPMELEVVSEACSYLDYILALYFGQCSGWCKHRCSSCIGMDRLLVAILICCLRQFLGGIRHLCHVCYFLDLLGGQPAASYRFYLARLALDFSCGEVMLVRTFIFINHSVCSFCIVSLWDVMGSDSHTLTPLPWIFWYLSGIVLALHFAKRPYLHSDFFA